MEFLKIALALVFLILGMIHMNWVIGGKWGKDNALPTNEKGEKILNPRRIDSLAVAFGLFFFSFFYFNQTSILDIAFPEWIVKYGGWIIPAIFILRAIGDFKYVGFFKKIRSTTFGKYDTKFYSPLCLFLGGVGFLVYFL